jgi:membrane-bound lytic murein transglycosylase B
MALQTLLKEKGIYNGAIDGLIGSETRHAIAIFQKEIGLPPDGFATIELLTRLRQ